MPEPARDWCVLDTETTGLGDDREPVEVAVVAADGRVVFESRVRPAGPISPDAYRVHRLSMGDLRPAPTFAEILPDLSDALGDRRVLGYGARFDRRTLELACRRADLPVPRCRWHCILESYHRLHSFRPPLRTACEIAGIPIPRGPHRATTDALLTWQLLQRLPQLLDR